MTLLTCTSKLATLQRALTRSFPESLKVYGALHNVIHNNVFRLQVLVDKWPDFTSVICRPPPEVMTEHSGPYIDLYCLFSKHTQSLLQMLQDPQTINWNQDLKIEGCHPELGEMMHTISSKHGSHLQTYDYFLYTRDGIKSEELEKLNNASKRTRSRKSRGHQVDTTARALFQLFAQCSVGATSNAYQGQGCGQF